MTLQIKPSQLLKESRDAMLTLLDCGVVLDMDTVHKRPNGQPICSVCAFGAMEVMAGDDWHPGAIAIEGFRRGNYHWFARAFQRPDRVRAALSDLPTTFWQGPTDPVPLLDHFDDAIARLERANL